ncbi:MAG: flagellar filament capping protein FliD [Usitatibacteraceae bacterium]
MPLSAPGIGSNLDVNGLVSQLMAIERQPLTQVQTREATVQAQLSAYGMLQSQIASFGDAAAALGKAERLSAFATSVADNTVASVSAGTNAVGGSYSLEVKQLAAVEKLATGVFAGSTSVVGTGTLTISLGTYDSIGNTFSVRTDKTPLTLTIDSSNNTLAGVRDAINAARSGVSATIVTDTGGARLVISGTETGAKNAIKIDSPAIGALAFNPTTVGVQAVARLQSAQDAKISIDNLNVVSSTNQVTGAIDGLTLNLLKAKPGEKTTIDVTRDGASVKRVLGEFVNSYNALNAMARSYTKYDAATKVKGALQGEVTAVSVINQLRTTITSVIPGGVNDFTRLSDIGIALQADGSLTLDDAKFTAATASGYDNLSRIFLASTSSPDTFVTRIKAFVDKTQGTNGLIPSKTEGLSATIKRFDKEQEKINTRLVSVEARLRRQFNALDSQLASQNAVSAYLTSQVAIWSNANSNN